MRLPALKHFYPGWDQTPDWDICELNTLPLDSAALPLLISDIKRRIGWTLRRSEKSPHDDFACRTHGGSYVERTISKKEKTKIAYYTNGIEEAFSKVSITKCDNVKELPAYLATLFGLHQKRWELKAEGPGRFLRWNDANSIAIWPRLLRSADGLSSGFCSWMESQPQCSMASAYRNSVYSLQEVKLRSRVFVGTCSVMCSGLTSLKR